LPSLKVTAGYSVASLGVSVLTLPVLQHIRPDQGCWSNR